MGEKTNSELGENTLPIRYFFACVIGKAYNGSLAVHSFDIKTNYGHPTYKRVKELSDEIRPNLTDVTIISISEMSVEDFSVFVSEK